VEQLLLYRAKVVTVYASTREHSADVTYSCHTKFDKLLCGEGFMIQMFPLSRASLIVQREIVDSRLWISLELHFSEKSFKM
jgi:hypothetical protein